MERDVIGGSPGSCGMTRHPTKDGWWRPGEGEESFIHTDDAPESWSIVDGIKRSEHYWRKP